MCPQTFTAGLPYVPSKVQSVSSPVEQKTPCLIFTKSMQQEWHLTPQTSLQLALSYQETSMLGISPEGIDSIKRSPAAQTSSHLNQGFRVLGSTLPASHPIEPSETGRTAQSIQHHEVEMIVAHKYYYLKSSSFELWLNYLIDHLVFIHQHYV